MTSTVARLPARTDASFALLCLVVFAAAAALYSFDPASSPVYAPCPFHYLTGLHCPGCGSLRALHQVLHARFTAAFALNPLMVLFLPYLAYEFLSRSLFSLNGRALPPLFRSKRAILALLFLILLFSVARNIPVYPLSLLAPH